MTQLYIIVATLIFSTAASAQNSGTRTDNCVEDRIIGTGTNQTIVLENYCTRDVEYTVCLDRSDVSWNGFKRGTVRANRSVKLYVNGLPAGGRYNYEYKWCYGSICKDQRIPDC